MTHDFITAPSNVPVYLKTLNQQTLMKWYLYFKKVASSKVASSQSKISRENGSYLLQYNYILAALVTMATHARP